MYSFQAPIRLSTNTATRPGAARGMAMRKMTTRRLAPSIRALSSISTGSPSKKSRITQTMKGMAPAAYTMISAVLVSSRRSSRNMTRKARMNSAPGNMRWAMKPRTIELFRPEKLKRARAYPAKEPMTSATPEETKATIMLFE